ncbi:DUF2474 domain-containing protein [Janthinobacterium aquaticum]|nr:DUF2474 domain-containing protein [Janthinobacterium sp. FT58W]KAB8044591.1 DUF2474 family protein [Janthinobacterium sp. FT58W]
MKRQYLEKPPLLWPKRLCWLLLIWLGSVMALGAAAGLLRLLMHGIGMSR